MTSLVIIPGWDNTAESWQYMVDKFSTVYPVVIDLPGFGKRTLLDASWGIPEYAAYVTDSIESMELKEVVLLGHSFGGRLATEIASQRPAWLKGLILYGAPCVYRPTLRAKALVALAKVGKIVGIRSRKLVLNKELVEAEKKGLGTVYRKTIGYDQSAQLKNTAVPTLLLWGLQDTEAPIRLAKEMQLFIHGSTLEIVDNAGHHLHLTHPHLFYGKIQKFISSL